MLNRRKDIEKKDFQRITYNILTSGGTGMEKENCLKVQMLGDFIITYKGKIVQLGKNQTTKDRDQQRPCSFYSCFCMQVLRELPDCS